MLPRSRLLLVAIILFAMLVGLWCLHFSYSEKSLYAAVPGRASFISTHDRLGDRWHELAEGSVGLTAARMIGLDSPKIFLESGCRYFVRFFLARNAVFAFVPSYLQESKGHWAFATWVGGKGQLLRWGLIHNFVKGLERAVLPDRTPCWIYRQGKHSVTVTLRGGMLLGVYGDAERLLQEMLSRLDSAPGTDIASIAEQRISSLREAFPDSRDVAWAAVPVGLSSDGSCLLALSAREDGVEVITLLENRLGVSGDMTILATSASGICGDMVDAVTVAEWTTVKNLIELGMESPEDDPLLAFLGEISSPSSSFFLSMMKPQFSGTIYNLKVPVFIAGLAVKPEVDVIKKVHDLMDRLNAEKGLGVIPVKMPTDSGPIVVAGGSKMNLFGGIKERPALTVRDGYLIFCSDMQSLLSLLQAGEGKSAVEQPRWESLMRAERGGMGAYVDFEDAEQAIRNSIAVYTLSLLAGGQGTAVKRRQLDAIRATVETLAEVGEATITAARKGSRLRISVVMGSEEGL